VQLAKRAGAYVVGIAGGNEKCSYVRDVLGADICIDYRSEPDLSAALQQACPQGIDVYFENVGVECSACGLSITEQFCPYGDVRHGE